ncbi:transposase [Streptomyces massasporeus]|uniref:transposase n=1 Tax=Streptomyces massasporeus TaxID=67324 RepID=UPI0036AE4AE5
MPAGCGRCWPGCRCRVSRAGRLAPGRSTCHRGCGRTAPCSAERLCCHVGPGEDGIAVHPELALLLCRRAGAGRHVLGRDPRRGAARAGGRRHRGHRAQLRGVVQRLITADQRQAGNQHIVIVSDADYDVTRLAWVLYDLPSSWSAGSAPTASCGCRSRSCQPGIGRPAKHGPEFRFTKPETWPEPPPSRTPSTTARLKSRRGTGSTPGSLTVPPGSTMTANSHWSRARCCG